MGVAGVGVVALGLFFAVPLAGRHRRRVAWASLACATAHGGAALWEASFQALTIPAWRHGAIAWGLMVALALAPRRERVGLTIAALVMGLLHVLS